MYETGLCSIWDVLGMRIQSMLSMRSTSDLAFSEFQFSSFQNDIDLNQAPGHKDKAGRWR